MNELSSRSNCSVSECFPEKFKWPWNEQVCQGVKCKRFEQSQGLHRADPGFGKGGVQGNV